VPELKSLTINGTSFAETGTLLDKVSLCVHLDEYRDWFDACGTSAAVAAPKARDCAGWQWSEQGTLRLPP
jgi:hypothetical protein